MNKIARIAAIMVIMLVVGWSVFTITRREAAHLTSDTLELRFAHPILDPGYRAAMAELAQAYEQRQAAAGRRIKLVPLEIPRTVYSQWVRTQLVGGTAPPLMVLTDELQRDIETVARYFRSVGGDVSDPNPYNAGTPHEGLRWRDTFIDGMQRSGYIFRLAEHYGIPISLPTYRLVANRRLLQTVLAEPANAALAAALGPSLTPTTFDQFITLCAATTAWAGQTDQTLFPIAASGLSGRLLMNHIVGSQTQRLLFEWSPLEYNIVNDGTTLIRLQKGLPIWEHEAFRDGLTLMRAVGVHLQPGFLQLRPEDANFAFATERALMILVNSIEASSLLALTNNNIDTVVFPLPLPMPGEPLSGRYALGEVSEGNVAGDNPYGIVNFTSPEMQDIALDFLRFLSSYESNQTFTRISGMLPVIAGVEPGPAAAPFTPRVDGHQPGPGFHMNNRDLQIVVDRHLHLLVSPRGGVESFLATVVPELRAEAAASLVRYNQVTHRSTARQDALIAAHVWLDHFAPDSVEDRERQFNILIDSSDGNESQGAQRESRLVNFRVQYE